MTGVPIGRRDLFRSTLAGVVGLAGVSAAVADGTEPSEDLSKGDVEEIDPDPDADFSYPYFLYVPDADFDDRRPLIVEPNNTGTSSDDFDLHRDRAIRRLEPGGRTREICDELGIPGLVPIFPRPASDPVDWTHYVHALDRTTLEIEDGPLERVDRQLLAMVDDARDRIAGLDVETEEEILLNGFSATGTFVNRFTALHPDRIRASAAGGINGTALLPVESVDGRTVDYHVGIADLESLVGHSFDGEAWADVDQFAYLGGDDDNDTIPYDDAWTDDERRQLALDVYGEDMQEDRMPTCRAIYEDADFTGRFETIPNVGHRPVTGEVIEFFRPHVASPFVRVRNQPRIGDEIVAVTVRVAEDRTSHEIRIYDGDENLLSDAPVDADGGGVERTVLSLDDALDAGASLTVAVVDPDTGEHVATDQAGVVGTVSFDETPTAGETSVSVSYRLAGSYDPDDEVVLRLDTEEGGARQVETVPAGAEGETGVEFDPSATGVPFVEGRTLDVLLADDDPHGFSPLARERVTIDSPDEPLVDVVAVDAPAVVTEEKQVSIEVDVRGLGGPSEQTSVGVSIANETEAVPVTLEAGERDTYDLSVDGSELDLEGIDSPEISIVASHGDRTVETTTLVAERPAVGAGTAAEPYRIDSVAELAYVDVESDAHYVLEADVDLGDVENFPPLGTTSGSFTGSLDGGGHAIEGLTVARSETADDVGLIGKLRDGEVRDLRLVDATVTADGSEFVGGVVGSATGDGVVERVTVSGDVAGERIVGGIVGGTSSGGSFSIRESASTASVSADSVGGGVLGQNSGHTLEAVYATGDVDAGGSSGGLVGTNWFGGTVRESYAVGAVAGDGNGLVGKDDGDGEVTDSYWDVETTGQDDSSAGGTGLQTADMTGEDAVDRMSGFDFEQRWEVTERYPELGLESADLVTATFLADPETASPGTAVTFDASRSIGEIVAYEWDAPGIEDFPESGDVVSYAFADSGEYEVSLTVTSEDGSTDTASRTVRVTETQISFDGVPAVGETEVTVSGRVGETEEGERIRVGDENDVEITESPASVSPGETFTGERLELARELEPGEEITALVQPTGSYDPAAAFASDTVRVGDSPDRSVNDYADPETDVVETDGLLEAIEDWREDVVDTDLLLEVIDAWRGGDPVD